MSRGIGAYTNKVAEDEHTAIYEYGEMLEDGRIVVENCSNCWHTTDTDLHVDVIACHLLFYIFQQYQEEGKIPETISYNV